MLHFLTDRSLLMADYPETERLSRDFLGHKKITGKSFQWYADQTSISRRTLIDLSTNSIRVLYETGKKLEMWMSKNKTLPVALDGASIHQ